MKRAVSTLQKERGNAERDARLRNERAVEAEAQERQKRVSQATAAKAKEIDALRERWKKENVKIASKFDVKQPVDNPLGAFSFSHRFHDFHSN
jgi:hypothetical protein